MKFSLSINVALTEYPIEKRMKIASEIGYDAVDYYGILDECVVKELCEGRDKHGIPVNSATTINAFKNTLNKRWTDIEDAFKRTISFAKQADIKNIAVLGGFKRSDFDEPKMLIIENAKRLAELAEKENVTYLLEPINNTLEHETAYVHTSAMGSEIVNAVNSDNFKMLFDFVHLEAAEGNVLINATQNIPIINMFHVVGIPRHDEPFYSQLDYPYIINELEKAGFDGVIGAEYEPSYNSTQSAKDVLSYMKLYKMREDMYKTK